MANRSKPWTFTVLSVLFAIFGCASTAPGPAFEWAAQPPNHRGRVYLYRADARTSLATVKASINGQEVGTFRDGEYETFEISAGGHRLRAGMRGLGFFSLGRNEHTFRVKPGETLFLHLEVRVDEGAQPQLEGPRALDIGGRSDNRMSENIFIGERTRADATPDLEVSTRLSSPD
jgi:hypothetical protein